MVKLKRNELDGWDQVDQIRLIDAAYLWIEQSPPGGDVPIEMSVHFRCEALLSAFRNNSGNIELLPTDRHSRSEYKRIAEKLGERPKFLYPEDRRKKTGQKPGTKFLRKKYYDEINEIIKTNSWPVSRAAAKVASRYHLRPSTVERDYRRYRDQLNTQKNS